LSRPSWLKRNIYDDPEGPRQQVGEIQLIACGNHRLGFSKGVAASRIFPVLSTLGFFKAVFIFNNIAIPSCIGIVRGFWTDIFKVVQ